MFAQAPGGIGTRSAGGSDARNLRPMEESKQRQNIALIGFRGSGKTTIGRLLAARLNLAFVDTDAMIVEQTGKSIADVFASEGEAAFRQYERDVVHQVVQQSGVVVSVGGGAVMDQVNAALLKEHCFVVWLRAPASVLHERITADCASAANRPRLTDLDDLHEVESLLARRQPVYEALADWAVDTDGIRPDAIIDELADVWRRRVSVDE